MKTQKFFGNTSVIRKVIVIAALAAAFAVPAVASAQTSVKSGDTCSKTQLNKTSSTFKCTYDSKTKKYTWAAAKATAKAGWPTKLVVAAVPSENVAAMTLKYANFVKTIEQATGLPTTFISATDYAGVIEAQVAGRADIVFYGPFSYVLAKARGAKIEAVGTSVPTATTVQGFYESFLVTKKTTTSINSIKDVKGKKLCFVDAASTSGFLYPTAGLLANGLTDRDYTSILAGGHDKSVLAVQTGTCDAGFVYDDMFNKTLPDAGKISLADYKIVWKSEPITNSPLAVRKDLPADLFNIIKTTVLEKINKTAFVAAGLCTSEATCNVIEDSTWGFKTTNDAAYDGIRQVCEATKSSKCR